MLQNSCPRGRVESEDLSEKDQLDAQPNDTTTKTSRRALFSLISAAITSCSNDSNFIGGENNRLPQLE